MNDFYEISATSDSQSTPIRMPGMRYRQQFSHTYRYDVCFTHHLFAPGNPTIGNILGQKQAKVLVFIDKTVGAAFPDLEKEITTWAKDNPQVMRLADSIISVTGGEAIKKDFKSIEQAAGTMLSAGICRHSYVMIIGGGAVLDAIGFAASIFHRGVRQIRVPTTVLAQDDSGVGIKNGINYNGSKNLFGCFYPPDAVIIDFNFITTLTDRDIYAGITEALKVALIRDAAFYRYLQAHSKAIAKRDQSVLEYVVKRSAELHMEHIGSCGDPFEKGSSRPLDFGHWAAHRLETLSANRLRHGEAVSIGMALDLYCAFRLELISRSEVESILDTFERCNMILWDSTLKARENGRLKILQGLKDFREHLGGKLTLSMPVVVGRATDIHDLPETVVEEALSLLEQRVRK